jgi:hypothetical protein
MSGPWRVRTDRSANPGSVRFVIDFLGLSGLRLLRRTFDVSEDELHTSTVDPLEIVAFRLGDALNELEAARKAAQS